MGTVAEITSPAVAQVAVLLRVLRLTKVRAHALYARRVALDELCPPWTVVTRLAGAALAMVLAVLFLAKWLTHHHIDVVATRQGLAGIRCRRAEVAGAALTIIAMRVGELR